MTANYWIHNAFITFAGSKISKSSGGLYTIKDLIELGFDPLSYKYLVIGSHYKKGMEFSVESLKSAQIALNKLRSYKSNLLGEINDQYRQEFIDKMTDNLATPEALALVWKMLKSDLSSEDKWATLLDFDRLLGLNLDKGVVEEVIPKNILELVEKRKQAREDKNWTESDYLRKVIEGEGYLVEDLTDSCKIRKIK
jgi:cysteinyl-tRNA synthetase